MAAEKVVKSLAQPVTLSEDAIESSSADSTLGYDEKAIKKLVRKIDLHILPVLVILYLLSKSWVTAPVIDLPSELTGVEVSWTEQTLAMPD